MLGNIPPMDQKWKDRLRKALQAKSLTMKAASKAANLGETYVRDILERDRAPTVDKLSSLASVLGVSVGYLLGESHEHATIPIVGKAAASADGQIQYANGDGYLGETDVPEGATEDSVAIEVEGYSMGFLADGALIYYTDRHDPPADDMLGLIVIVGLDDDRVLLKKLLRGSQPGLFDLESINGPTLRDQQVQWAAHIDCIVPPWRAKRIRK